MADLDKIVEDLSSLTVIDAAELVKKLEEKWDVSAAAPAAVAMAAPAAGDDAGAAEEKDSFDVILVGDGGNKVQAIKAVRAIKSELGLKEAKELVDGAPTIVKESSAKEEAEDIKKQLEEAGATVTLK